MTAPRTLREAQDSLVSALCAEHAAYCAWAAEPGKTPRRALAVALWRATGEVARARQDAERAGEETPCAAPAS